MAGLPNGMPNGVPNGVPRSLPEHAGDLYPESQYVRIARQAAGQLGDESSSDTGEISSQPELSNGLPNGTTQYPPAGPVVQIWESPHLDASNSPAALQPSSGTANDASSSPGIENVEPPPIVRPAGLPLAGPVVRIWESPH